MSFAIYEGVVQEAYEVEDRDRLRSVRRTAKRGAQNPVGYVNIER